MASIPTLYAAADLARSIRHNTDEAIDHILGSYNVPDDDFLNELYLDKIDLNTTLILLEDMHRQTTAARKL